MRSHSSRHFSFPVPTHFSPCTSLSYHFYAVAYLAIFPILCTMQYSYHCVSTFSLPRGVNRSRTSVYLILVNTGSTVPFLLLWKNRPRIESNRSIIRCTALFSWRRISLFTFLTCLAFEDGLRRHLPRNWQLLQYFSRSPCNFDPCIPLPTKLSLQAGTEEPQMQGAGCPVIRSE